jgi:hypothetical protein
LKIAAIILFLSLIAIYGARVRGSVFRIVFRILVREFESVETSAGFVQLLGENLVSLCKTADRFHEASKKIVKSQKCRSDHCDFTKKIVSKYLWITETQLKRK